MAKKNRKNSYITRFARRSEVTESKKRQGCLLRSTGKIPPGCEACGGPYPLCAGGCPIFD